jgi:ribonuclease BN (tRNA processing enzyme)
MHVQFLGTAAKKITNHRNYPSIAVIFENNEFALVDCGEATQHQLMQTALNPSNLHSIYITHLDGPQIFGLPGLLSSLNNVRHSELSIYGPRGLKSYLRFSTNNISSYNVIVNEYNHGDDIRSLVRFKSGQYEFMVSLARVSHSLLSYAYKFIKIRITEEIDRSRFQGHMERYEEELNQMGFLPGNQLIPYLIKEKDQSVVMKDGFEFCFDKYKITENVLSLVIAMDNTDCNPMCYYFQNCDTLIFASTIHFNPNTPPSQVNVLEQTALKEYCSTNRSAARAAYALKAKQLILTHFDLLSEEDETGLIWDTRTHLPESQKIMKIACARDLREFICI